MVYAVGTSPVKIFSIDLTVVVAVVDLSRWYRRYRPTPTQRNYTARWSGDGDPASQSAVGAFSAYSSYVFGRRRGGNSCPPPGESGVGSGNRRGVPAQVVVVVKPPSPLSVSRSFIVRPTAFQYGPRRHVQQQSNQSRSCTVGGRFPETRRHVEQPGHSGGRHRSRVHRQGRPVNYRWLIS